MSIFDFLKKKDSSGPDISSINSTIIENIIDEGWGKKSSYTIPPLTGLESYKELIAKDDIFIKGFINSCILKLAEVKKKKGKSWVFGSKESDKPEILISLLSLLVRRKIQFTDDELLNLIKTFVNNLNKKEYYSGIPYKPLLTKIEFNLSQSGLNDALSASLKLLLVEESPYMRSENTANNQYINYLLQGSSEKAGDSLDPFGKVINDFIASIDDESKKSWSALFKLLIDASGKTNPTAKWINETKSAFERIDKSVVVEKYSEWITLCVGLLKQIHKNGGNQVFYLKEINHDILKGIIWSCGIINNPDLNILIDEYGLMAFKKLTNVGAVSVRTGNACLYCFSILPFMEGISRLTKFRMKIKYPSVLKQVDKYIDQVAKREGYTKDKLEEISVPDFGLKDGVIKKQIGECTAVIEVKGIYEIDLSWVINGKQQASVPAKIKTDHKEELNAVKKLIKEIESFLPVQRDRVEQFYLKSRTWDFGEWYSSYISHPLMNIIAGKLIWHVYNQENKTECFYLKGQLVDVNNNPISLLGKEAKVQLWHPIGFSSDVILSWREFLEREQIKQPFKQAYREIYIVTDAELNTHSYSNRFAAHILRQHQFTALCKQRGWYYTVMGNWDSHNTPFIELPEWNIRTEFFVDADWNETAVNEAGVFNYISTDQVRFFKGREQLNMEDVPAMVFTEMMRDVDLFVGVTSIGNDAAWQDGGNQIMDSYWKGYSFAELSESAKIREQVLKRLIPRLKIAEQCSFDGKYLVVEGKIRTYKIHIGSGNILMKPNDQYLCIVPGRSNKSGDKLFLPFEGDNMLSIIISKALLLSEDDKITDTTITSQINRK